MVALAVGDSIGACTRMGRNHCDWALSWDSRRPRNSRDGWRGCRLSCRRSFSRNAAAIRRLLVILPVALLTFYILNPPIWYEPLDGLRDHFHRSLNRANTLNISTQFLGRTYNVTNPLPWYNTLVWLVFATPLPTLALGVVGLWHCLARPTAFSVTLMLHWITLMVVRALPGAPPHDGIRLFLPAFGFWCVFAGIGAQRVFNLIGTVRARLVENSSALGALQALFWRAPSTSLVTIPKRCRTTVSSREVFEVRPTRAWNRRIGGMRSTTTSSQWLDARTGADEAIAFSPVFNLGHLRDWGKLRAHTVNAETGRFKWYVLQNRPAMFTRTDRRLMEREKPAYVKYAGRRRSGEAVPRDLDVPLISVFSFDQYQRARRRSGR